MIREITDQAIILDAIRQLDILCELLEEENGKPKYCKKTEQDKIIKGYIHAVSKKRVPPYLRMLEYGPGEVIMRQGEWGGNTLYVVVEGTLDVSVMDSEGAQQKFVLQPGAPFGEMSVLAGVERNATISVPATGGKVTALEISRPAIQHLRVLPKFGAALDSAYRDRSFSHLMRRVEKFTHESFTPEQFRALGEVARFMVYGKHHVLCQEGEPIEKIIFIKDGWVRRVRGMIVDSGIRALVEGANAKVGVDYLGAGNCLGLEWKRREGHWPYGAIVMARTEVLELSIPELLSNRALLDKVLETFSTFSHADDEREVTRDEQAAGTMAAAEKEIATGIVDASNLLVMDMDLCIRCGNCSLACHHVHGQSRLLRRGIHIERPVKLGSKRTQHVLSPQVCMHCQDPECLTGCPTGAIFRGGGGLIDINLETCIGCFDCANQCPYNVISMVPVEAEAPATPDWARFDLLGRLKRLRGKPPAAPAISGPASAPASTPASATAAATLPAVATATPAASAAPGAREGIAVKAAVKAEGKAESKVEGKAEGKAENRGMVAIKCNLCENTPMNPAGARRKAYSCEENCPTGALVRVNPQEYFSEIENSIGIIFRNETQAIGRNIHKRDPLARLWHISGALLTMALIVVTLRGLQQYGYNAQLGGTWLTMRWATGLAGLAGILGVMAYPVRKQIYRRRAGALRYWMLAHVYLGVIGSVLIWLHGGAHTGGLLTTALHLSFDFVIASGLFGLASYIIVPRIMTSIEGEPLLIEDLTERRDELSATLDKIEQSDVQLGILIEGKVRPRFLSFRYLMRQYLKREELTALLAQARAESKSEPYLLTDKAARQKFMEAVEAAATMRRVDALIYLHHLLKIWLAPHIISTTVMLALLVAHIAQAIYFSAR